HTGEVLSNINQFIVDDDAEVTSKGLELGFVDTDFQATKLDVSVLKSSIFRRTATYYIVDTIWLTTITAINTGCISTVVEAGFGVGLQCAVFGFRSGRSAQCETSALVPAATFKTGVSIIATLNVVTDVAMNAQAGFSAWNVEVACAVSIANAD